MQPYTLRQQQLIVNNVVAACRDISKLNKTGYQFISGCSGFIAHYDLQGFKAHYNDQWGHYCDNNLKADIVEYQRFNQWRNFREGQQHFDYAMSKKAIYNAIVEAIIKQSENVAC